MTIEVIKQSKAETKFVRVCKAFEGEKGNYDDHGRKHQLWWKLILICCKLNWLRSSSSGWELDGKINKYKLNMARLLIKLDKFSEQIDFLIIYSIRQRGDFFFSSEL